MKKFMKNSAITALVMILVGIIAIATAIIVKGPEVITAITQYSSEALDGLNIVANPDLITEFDFDSDIPMLAANTQHTIDTAGITQLDIELGACELQILPSEDQFFYAHVNGAGLCQVYSEAQTLCVKASTGSISLYIPKDYSFDRATISVGAGQISGFSAIHITELEMELAAGEIHLSNVEAGNLDAEVGAGSLVFSGNILQSVNAECSMGNLTLQLTGEKTDYNYDVDVAAGEITIGEESFGGLAGERQINNNASKNINVECAMGNIEISFAEN